MTTKFVITTRQPNRFEFMFMKFNWFLCCCFILCARTSSRYSSFGPKKCFTFLSMVFVWQLNCCWWVIVIVVNTVHVGLSVGRRSDHRRPVVLVCLQKRCGRTRLAACCLFWIHIYPWHTRTSYRMPYIIMFASHRRSNDVSGWVTFEFFE